MPIKGSANRAEGNSTLCTVCARCGKPLPTEVGHAHPLDQAVRRETWGLVGQRGGWPAVFPTCTACRDAGWRPPSATDAVA
jgi:5-methylcytosine-specific restriction endonuclease McrA